MTRHVHGDSSSIQVNKIAMIGSSRESVDSWVQYSFCGYVSGLESVDN